MAYGPGYSTEGRDGARYVDKILKGVTIHESFDCWRHRVGQRAWKRRAWHRRVASRSVSLEPWHPNRQGISDGGDHGDRKERLLVSYAGELSVGSHPGRGVAPCGPRSDARKVDCRVGNHTR